MDVPLSDIKDWLTIAKPFIDPLISTIIKPRLDQLSKYLKKQEQNHALVDNVFENKFEQFLARTYSHSVSMNILIFQNLQIKIQDIYCPLTIRCSKDNSRFKVGTGGFGFITKYKRVLISDSAGMGKSTLMKWITCQIIEARNAIPILIELRNLNETHDLLAEICSQINQLDDTFDRELIVRFLELGNFTILLDGFDEIQPKAQERVIKGIRDFINKAPNNEFILTSRPEGALSSFGDFQLFNIDDLTHLEACNLIEKYDSISPTKVAEALIRDIETNFQQTKELLNNPFLVSLIYCTYTYNKDIPSRKITFYEEIYSALFKRHDLSKDGWTREKKSKLDIHYFKSILRQLAFDTALAGKIAYRETEILDFIDKAKVKSAGINFMIPEFLDDLLSAVPLFQRDGSRIKWAHKSLQDYFAADFIAFDSRKEDIIGRIYASKRDGFLNLLELFCELDYKTFRKVVLRPLFQEYVSFYKKHFKDIDGVSKIHIESRISLLFDQKVAIVKEPRDEFLNDNKYYAGVYDHVETRDLFQGNFLSSHAGGYTVYSSMSFKRGILAMMAAKNHSCVTLHYFYPTPDRPNIDAAGIKDGELVLVDNSPGGLLNTKSHFSTVNKFLISHFSTRHNFYVDYKKVIEELKAIDEEIASESEVNRLFDI